MAPGGPRSKIDDGCEGRLYRTLHADDGAFLCSVENERRTHRTDRSVFSSAGGNEFGLGALTLLRRLTELINKNLFGKMVHPSPDENASVPASSPARAGQVAVALILIIAIALIFYAITLNLGRIVQNKLTTTVSANKGASILALQMAS